MIVLDASVAVKAVNREDDSPLVLADLAGHPEICAPEIIRTEVVAAITKQVRRRVIPADLTQRLCRQWLDMMVAGPISLIPTWLDERHGVDLSLTLHPYHDCLYLAAAIRLDAPLISAAATLIAKARLVHPRAMLLRDIAAG